jgi:hypothetical protein
MSPFEDILTKRGKKPFSGLPHQFLELLGGKPVEMIYYEPDANTFRDQYYYNTRENKIYKKLKAGTKYVWKDASTL